MTALKIYTPARANGNGATTAFVFAFDVQDAADLVVSLVDDATNTPVVQTIITDYTVVINAAQDGGTVTWVVAPPSTHDSLIERLVDVKQTTNIPDVGQLTESQLEDPLDSGVLISQQIDEKVDRSFKLSAADSTFASQISYEFPLPVANRALFWASDAKSIVNSSTDLSSIDAAVASTAADAVSTAADVVSTAADVVLTAADVVSTDADVTAAAASATAAAAAVIGRPFAYGVRIFGSGTLHKGFTIKNGLRVSGVVLGTTETLTAGDATLDASSTASYDDATLSLVDTSYGVVAFMDSSGTDPIIFRFVKKGNISNANITYPSGGYDDFKRVGWLRCNTISDVGSAGAGTLTHGTFSEGRFTFAAGTFSMVTHTGTLSVTALDVSGEFNDAIRRILCRVLVGGTLTADISIGITEGEVGAAVAPIFIYANDTQSSGTEYEMIQEFHLSSAGTFTMKLGNTGTQVNIDRYGFYDSLEVEQ